MVISPHLTSPHSTDFRTLEALFASSRLKGRTGQDLIIGIWELVVDKDEGLYHFWPALEKLTDHFVWDPLKLFNVFGWSICGVTANLMAVLYKEAGFPDARICNLIGHEATEVYYEGRWHFLDGDLQAFHRRHPPEEDEIAGYEECLRDPTLVSHQQNPSSPYYLADRPPEGMAKLYEREPSYSLAFADRAHTMDFVLRPGETLERNTYCEGKWVWFSNFTEGMRRYPGEWNQDGPRERSEPHRRYGNGRWIYEPRLTEDYVDFEAGVLLNEGMRPTSRGLVTSLGGQNRCVFDFDSPYVYAGTPSHGGEETPRDGCIVDATVCQCDDDSRASLQLQVDPDRLSFTVWESPGEGRHELRLDLTEHVVNSYRYLLQFQFDAAAPGACAIEDLRVTSSVMVAPESLGKLVEGTNPLTLRFGDACGLPTRRWLTETNFRSEQDVRAKTCQLSNLQFLPDTEDRILPVASQEDYEIVFRVDAPPHGCLQRIYAFGSFRGKDPDDPLEDRVAAYLALREAGPWRPLFESPVLPEPHRWHFSAQGELALDEPAEVAFVKFVGKVGMNMAKVRAHWLDDRLGANPSSLLVTHAWQEGDGDQKSHTEQVASQVGPLEYELSCGPDPKLKSVVMKVESVRREG